MRFLLHCLVDLCRVRDTTVREFAEARFVNLLDKGKLMRPQSAVLGADHPLVQVQGSGMSIEVTHSNCASETQVVAEITGNGFTAAAKDYKTGKTEPHRHDYDICLHILEGEFRLTEVDEGVVHSFGVGDRFLVPAGMLHFEDHGPLRLVVGRRNLEEGSA